MQFSLKTKISTPRYQETRDFYQRLFGMTVAEEWDSEDDVGVILTFAEPRGEAFLEIYRCNEVHNFDGLSLQFRTDDLEGFVDALPDELAYEGPKDRPWGSRYVYIRDPNDILLIVYDGGL